MPSASRGALGEGQLEAPWSESRTPHVHRKPEPTPTGDWRGFPVVAPSARRSHMARPAGSTSTALTSWEGLHMRIRVRTTWPAKILGRAVPRVLLVALAGGALLLSA